MSLRIAYRRVVGLIAYGLFKIPLKSAVWLTLENPFEVRCVADPALVCRQDAGTARGRAGSAPRRRDCRYLIRRNPPMPLRVAYCRVVGLIA
jgi:hypothetical protein